jgi:ATP-dependent DNA helicase RecG
VFERKDEPLFPIAALREALLNAFAHRDYSIAGGSVHVAVYSDRVEITNPGALPPGLTIDDLKGNHSSIPRNPLIADILYKRGLVETWGRGTSLIVRLCRDAGHPEPVFFSMSGTFGVRLRSSRPINRAGILGVELSPRRREILEVLGVRALSAAGVRAGMVQPPAVRTVRADHSALKKAGLVESKGRGAGAVWLRRNLPADGSAGDGTAAKA